MDEKIRMIRRIIMNKVLEEISKIGIVPVIALDHVEDAAPLAKALCDGGLPCAEVTFRTAAAEESIRIMAEQFPEMLVGAGTVLTTEQVDRAVNAGAKFIVSPGLNPKVVKYCVEKGIPVTPGCSNPSDVEVAIELGLDVVKFFPAEAAGGLNMIKSMAAPYVNMKFMPTGGINAKNLTNYLDFNKIIACGGSWMVSKDLVAAKDWAGITALTKEAVSTMLGFKLLHVGVNNASEEAAASDSAKFATLLGQDVKVGNSSMFVGSLIEMMKNPGRGTCGHIAIQTNYLTRAMYHLEKRGFVFDESSFKYDANNRLIERTDFVTGVKGGIKTQYTYNANDSLVSTKIFKANLPKNTTTATFSNNKKQNETNINGRFKTVHTYTYNDKGDLSKDSINTNGKSSEITYEYTYDTQGNWTTRTQYNDGKVKEMIQRDIEYYSSLFLYIQKSNNQF